MHKLHLIEPTLFDQTGHGFSYASSIIKANDNLFTMHIWLDKKGVDLFNDFPCTAHLYFYRQLRRLQKIMLYYKLLKTPDLIYVCTAELIDLIILNWLQKKISTKAKVFLHFHQFKRKASKLKTLQKIAAENKTMTIYTPTDKLTELFQNHGFENCQTIPCPSFARNNTQVKIAKKFSKILYAGAARKDKGFPEVVDFLAYCQNNNIQLPVTMQISSPNSGRYDQATKLAMQKLTTLNKKNILLHTTTLTQAQYQELFSNAICLLIYDKNSYNDKFSGIALDAFYAGCPIITIAETWMGNTVNRFDAGITLVDRNPENILHAIQIIRQNYQHYSMNADRAATMLAREHDPQNTLLALMSPPP